MKQIKQFAFPNIWMYIITKDITKNPAAKTFWTEQYACKEQNGYIFIICKLITRISTSNADEINISKLSGMFVVWEMSTFIVLVHDAVDPVQVTGDSAVESKAFGLVTAKR